MKEIFRKQKTKPLSNLNFVTTCKRKMLQAYVSSHYWWLFSFVFTANCFSALFGRFLTFYVDRNSFLSISCDPFNPFSTNVPLLDPLKASLLKVTKMQKNFFETFLTEGFSLKAKDIFGPKNAKLQNFNRRDMGWRRVTVKVCNLEYEKLARMRIYTTSNHKRYFN